MILARHGARTAMSSSKRHSPWERSTSRWQLEGTKQFSHWISLASRGSGYSETDIGVVNSPSSDVSQGSLPLFRATKGTCTCFGRIRKDGYATKDAGTAGSLPWMHVRVPPMIRKTQHLLHCRHGVLPSQAIAKICKSFLPSSGTTAQANDECSMTCKVLEARSYELEVVFMETST